MKKSGWWIWCAYYTIHCTTKGHTVATRPHDLIHLSINSLGNRGRRGRVGDWMGVGYSKGFAMTTGEFLRWQRLYVVWQEVRGVQAVGVIKLLGNRLGIIMGLSLEQFLDRLCWARLFWNQVLTCRSVILRATARTLRSAGSRYCWSWNRFSSALIWSWLNLILPFRAQLWSRSSVASSVVSLFESVGSSREMRYWCHKQIDMVVIFHSRIDGQTDRISNGSNNQSWNAGTTWQSTWSK